MRVAQSRLGVLDALADVRRGVDGCIRALPLPARFLKLGALAAVGAVAAGMLRHLLPFSRRKSTPPAMGRFVFSELLAGLVLPLCRSYLLDRPAVQEERRGRAEAASRPRRGGFFSRLLRRG